jgi:hypothetical protein
MTNSSPPLSKAIIGPVLLITLGSLLALDHAGIYAFSRTWSALLIVWGVLKLFDHLAGGSGSAADGGQS